MGTRLRQSFPLSDMTIPNAGQNTLGVGGKPWITAETLRRFGLAVVLAMCLRTFTFFPGLRILEELWFVLCGISFMLLYPLFKIQSDWNVTVLELYLAILIAVSIFLPAFTSHEVFGQPLGYGILARRGATVELVWLLLIGAWRRRWVTAARLESALVALIWATFVLYTAMRLFLNPANFPGAPAGFVLASGTGGATFSVPGPFMTFGVLYYALKGLREKRFKFYMYALILLVNAVGPSGRFLIVSLLATIAYFLVRWRPLAQVLVTFAQFILVGMIALAITYRINPEATRDRVQHFVAAIQVVTGNAQGEDASANARVVESDIAYPYIRAHPLLGVGILSAQWTGAAGQVSDYFFPDDIGLVGILFTYGFLCLPLFTLQYVFAVRASFAMPSGPTSALLDGTKAFVLYTAINSLTTGLFVFNFEQSSFFIVLLVLLVADMRMPTRLAAETNRVRTLPMVAA